MASVRLRYSTITKEEDLTALVSHLRGQPLAIDLETQSLQAGHRQIVGVALSNEPGVGFYIPVGHVVEVGRPTAKRGLETRQWLQAPHQLPYDMVMRALKTIIDSSDDTHLVFHNAKFDTRFLELDGVHVPEQRVVDTLILAGLSGQSHSSLGLKDLASKLFRVRPMEFESLFPRSVRVADRQIARIDVEIASDYACADADHTWRLYQLYYEKVHSEREMIFAVEHALWPVVRQLEAVGAGINLRHLKASADYLRRAYAMAERLIWDQYERSTGQRWEFNLRSPVQLREVLFNKLGLPVRATTDTGTPSTEEQALTWARGDHPIVPLLLEARSLATTAVQLEKTIPENLGSDGRVHTQYNQMGASTGRFSSSKPNLQNIAKEKHWQFETETGTVDVSISPRDAFVARRVREADPTLGTGRLHPYGTYLVELDFRQIEFVVMAVLAGCQSVVDAYAAGRDVHRLTYSDVMGIPEEEVTKSQRDSAKTWNYLLIYGGSANALSNRTGQSEEAAEAAMDRFFAARPEFQRFIQGTRSRAGRTHTVETHFGRLQYVPEYDIPGARHKAERACVNRIIQGTAADIQKMGLLLTNARVPEQFPGARLILQTHDSQTWEVPRIFSPDDVIPVLIDAMSPRIQGWPRLQVDAKVGYSWGQLHGWEPGKEWDWAAMEAVYDTKLDELEAYASDAEILPLPPQPVLKAPHALRLLNVRVEDSTSLLSILRAFPGTTPVSVVGPDGREVGLREKVGLDASRMAVSAAAVNPAIVVEEVEWEVAQEAAVQIVSAILGR